MSARLVAASAGLALAAGCTVFNGVDVCRRGGVAENQLNQVNVTCDQRIDGPQAIAPLPAGGALVVFTSQQATEACGATPAGADLWGTVVDAQGAPVAACGADTEVRLSTGTIGGQQAAVAPPTDADHPGLLAFIAAPPAGGAPRVYAVGIDAGGCAGQLVEPLAVSAPATDQIDARAPTVVRVGDQLFLVVWTELRGPETSVTAHAMARMYQHLGAGVFMPVPTQPAPGGGPAELASGTSAAYVTAAAEDDGRVAVAWYEPAAGAVTVAFELRDSTLAVARQARPVGTFQQDARDFGASSPGVAVAYDGAQFMVAWTARDAGGPQRLFARFFSPDGDSLAAPDAPDGSPFRVGSASDGDEGDPALAPLAGGGFLAAWDERDVPDRADADGAGVRAVAFDPGGGRRFADRACDATDFQLDLDTTGDQTRPALARMVDDTVLAVWTDGSDDGADRSGTGVRAAALGPHDLFALP